MATPIAVKLIAVLRPGRGTAGWRRIALALQHAVRCEAADSMQANIECVTQSLHGKPGCPEHFRAAACRLLPPQPASRQLCCAAAVAALLLWQPMSGSAAVN